MDFASTPSFFSSGPPPAVRLTIAVVASLAFLVSDHYWGLMKPLRDTTSLVLYPIQHAVNLPAQAARYVGDLVSTQIQLKNENTNLQTRQLEMSAQLGRLGTMQRELNELRQLNGMKGAYQLESTMAETLYTGRDPFSHKIIIDKGSENAIKEGQPVVDANGLLGQVSRVQALTSEVTLIIDKNQMVPVMIARTGQRTILHGYGGGIELRYLPQSADIKQGERIVTSGIDGVYPQGIPVARIDKVRSSQGGPFANVLITPLAGVEQTRYVLVLKEKIMPSVPVPVTETVPPKKSKTNRRNAR